MLEVWGERRDERGRTVGDVVPGGFGLGRRVGVQLVLEDRGGPGDGD